MAIYYKLDYHEKEAIYGTAEKWKNNCLLDDKSLIWESESIWTNNNISRFRSIFIDSPDESGESFDNKLKKQLNNESEDVHKFVIELLFIYYMYPVRQSISYETKIQKLEMIASWKNITIDTSLSVFDGLKKGLGTTGTFFNTSKYFEVSFLFRFVEYLKSQPIEKRKTILKKPVELKNAAEDVRQQVGKRVQMQHIVLHLLLPEYFERISSWGNKSQIVKAYSDLIRDSDSKDQDKQLLMIREKLKDKYGSDRIDFYETPGIAEKWRSTVNDGTDEKEKYDTILIKIGVSFQDGMSAEELYYATSGSWKISESKLNAGDFHYYCAVYDNQIKGVYELNDFKEDTRPDHKGRFILEGKPADKEIRNLLFDLDVSCIHTSKGNPIKYTSKQKLLDLAEKEGRDMQAANYFWLTCNPSIWTVDKIRDGRTTDYTAYSDNGNKRRVFNAFEKAKAGDQIIFYESSPRQKVIARGEIAKGLHKNHGEDVISFQYLDEITPIKWSEIKNHDLLKESSVVGNAQGSLFELTKQEYEAIINWEESLDKDMKVEIPSVDFNVEPFDNGLIFENINVLMNQVRTAIANGKHVILTGPPGTGKSKLASKICDMYDVQSAMVTAASNWSTYETIGGYRPGQDGNLYFDNGIFLTCVKQKGTNQPKNDWLIIDEINRADIDKAFGSLFSVLTGDEVILPFESRSGYPIRMKPQGEIAAIDPNDHTYVIPNDWRIIATMNTIDKVSLYEMSYAFMRRFAFIPVGIPKDITPALVEQYLKVWDMDRYPNAETLTTIWKLINTYRKIGPAIVKDIAMHTLDNEDFTSAIILYVLPQFEGLPIKQIKDFTTRVVKQTDVVMEQSYLDDFVNDFFDVGAFE